MRIQKITYIGAWKVVKEMMFPASRKKHQAAFAKDSK
jgi:hypothetical protein